jgi:cold shock CspA family protein
MDKKNGNIKADIIKHIGIYANGCDRQKNIAKKMEIIVENMNCLLCLDTHECWFYRGEEYIDDKGEYYKCSCIRCPDESLRNKWIEDSHTNEMTGLNGYELFNRESHAASPRFEAIEKFVIRTFPELCDEEPTFKNAQNKNINYESKSCMLNFELGNVVKQSKHALRMCIGDPSVVSSILEDIRVNVETGYNNNEEEQVICKELDDNTFVYVSISNNSAFNEKKIGGIFHYKVYELDFRLSVASMQATNSTAIKQCRNIINIYSQNQINNIKTGLSIFTPGKVLNIMPESMKRQTIERRKGVIKKYNIDKGTGYITDDNDHRDYAFHYTAVNINGSDNVYEKLQSKQPVSYIETTTKSGKRAFDIELIGESLDIIMESGREAPI